MTLRTGASVAALAIVLGFTPAAAQMTDKAPSAAETKVPVTGQIMVQDSTTVLAKDFIGQNVYAPDKAKVGSISDLILSKDGKTVEGFVIGVGGFLGIGEKSVALKMDRLNIAQNADGAMLLTMDAKKEELANAPAFKSKRDQDRDKQAAERSRDLPGPKRP